MNIFELTIVASPAAGRFAGIGAAKGHSTVLVLASALGGSLVGIGMFVACFISSMWVASLFRTPGSPPLDPGVLEWASGVVGLLLVAASPFGAWWLVWMIIPQVLGNAG